jgi:hypothetical protein
MLKVNSHIHTPYSFSAFESIDQAFELALGEGIQVLGINDFFVTDGYEEFARKARKYGIYPLFNIEFIGLLSEEQEKGIRVNDPNNPGRTYFCGKALRNPMVLPPEMKEKLDRVVEESQEQVRKMVGKLSVLLKGISAPFSLDYQAIKRDYARELVRERHIAQALRAEINNHFPDEESRRSFLNKLYAGAEVKADLSNNSDFEGELRSRLLKSGGSAFVPEDESSFLPVPELVDIIIKAGGIPCYPVLLDDKNGNYTEFEGDFEKLMKRLKELNVGAVELIPGRNNIDNLKRFTKFFHSNGFLVSFGTEHNTPELAPLEVKAGGGIPLDDYLLEVNDEAVCIYAFHQDRIGRGLPGYLDADGRCRLDEKNMFIKEGRSVIEDFLNK